MISATWTITCWPPLRSMYISIHVPDVPILVCVPCQKPTQRFFRWVIYGYINSAPCLFLHRRYCYKISWRKFKAIEHLAKRFLERGVAERQFYFLHFDVVVTTRAFLVRTSMLLYKQISKQQEHYSYAYSYLMFTWIHVFNYKYAVLLI